MLNQLIMEVRAALEERLARLKKRAIALTAAAVLFGFAFIFGLIALFAALQEEVGPGGAALILFIILAAGGAVALTIGREREARHKRREIRAIDTEPRATSHAGALPSRLTSSGWPLIFTAFAAGLALSRARFGQWRRNRG
jgi:Kef-type K+ transport system membrane component KefB